VAGGYRLAPEARANLDDICAFIAEDTIDAALRLLEAFAHAFDQLVAMPGIGHTRETIGRMKGLSSRVTPTGTASLQIRRYTISPPQCR
jgi:plasmid stabilization system protein ParE